MAELPVQCLGFVHSILHVRGGCTLFVSQWNTDINPNTCDAPDISVMLFRDYVPSKGYTPSKRGNTVKFKNKKKQSLLQWIQTQPEQIIGWLVREIITAGFVPPMSPIRPPGRVHLPAEPGRIRPNTSDSNNSTMVCPIYLKFVMSMDLM